MFQRLCIHVIQRLRPAHAHLYLQPGMEDGCVSFPLILSLFLWSPLTDHPALMFPNPYVVLYCVFWSGYSSDDMDGPVEDIGSRSCVTRFVKTLLSIMEHGVKPHSKHLTEYFAFLYEFAKMGEEEVAIPVFIYVFIYLL